MGINAMIWRAIGVAGLAVSTFLPAQPAAAGEQLTIVSWGGNFQDAQRKAYFEPFAKDSGIKVIEDQWNGEQAKIRAMVETNNVTWDVVVGGTTGALCAAGMLETIEWNKVGLDPEKFNGRQECAVPANAAANIITYDKDQLPSGPTTIADFFDLKKFPGKRGLNKRPYINLEWALIADGVAIDDVYKVLDTPEGVDRAFKKLDTIKENAVWWESGAQPAQLLADRQVVMTSAWNGRIYDAVKNSGKNFAIMWDSQILSYDYFTIPKGTPHLDAAYRFIAFASAPKAQAEMAGLIPYAPGNADAAALVDPKVLPYLPSTPEHMAKALTYNEAFWAEKGDELNQRFTAWLAK
ncbi:ABC transporter substrate-binding protein [Rhizobium etli]|uniref:ABC transporter substrate-binding protein n=1 Tax=Rhizobium etli TaxID=29449 RepID=UPI0003839407|nr:ABC transporter substrate-binding protein [Rhizobium etli]AGS25331.1 spermidine/putrescine ABC transporter substrate-binding protein [Rhizobium etli bv. mimosae str. Mim1]